jgi:hypothetical protein
MGLLDRIWNLGKGSVISRRGGRGERISEAELERELQTVQAPQPAATPEARSAEPVDEPAPAPELDESGKVIKTL